MSTRKSNWNWPDHELRFHCIVRLRRNMHFTHAKPSAAMWPSNLFVILRYVPRDAVTPVHLLWLHQNAMSYLHAKQTSVDCVISNIAFTFDFCAGNDCFHVQCAHKIGQTVRIRYTANVPWSIRSCTTCAACQRYRCNGRIEGSWRKWAHRCAANRIEWGHKSHIVERGIAQNGKRGGWTHIGGNHVSHLYGPWDRHKFYTLWTHYVVQFMRRKVSSNIFSIQNFWFCAGQSFQFIHICPSLRFFNLDAKRVRCVERKSPASIKSFYPPNYERQRLQYLAEIHHWHRSHHRWLHQALRRHANNNFVNLMNQHINSSDWMDTSRFIGGHDARHYPCLTKLFALIDAHICGNIWNFMTKCIPVSIHCVFLLWSKCRHLMSFWFLFLFYFFWIDKSPIWIFYRRWHTLCRMKEVCYQI